MRLQRELTFPLDVLRNYLIIDRSTLDTRLHNIHGEKKKEDDKEKKALLDEELLEVKHLLKLQNFAIELRGAGNKEILQAKLDKAKKDWDSKHPKNTTDLVDQRFWARHKKVSPSKAPPNQKSTKSSGSQAAQTETASTSIRGTRSNNT